MPGVLIGKKLRDRRVTSQSSSRRYWKMAVASIVVKYRQLCVPLNVTTPGTLKLKAELVYI